MVLRLLSLISPFISQFVLIIHHVFMFNISFYFSISFNLSTTAIVSPSHLPLEAIFGGPDFTKYKGRGFHLNFWKEVAMTG
jgi:heme/copper-type cytochrome/quinol oxidase subunit 1